jgi:predicted secreted Zn-dependent protease
MMRLMLVFAFVMAAGFTSVSAEEIVRYRLPEWKRKHLHDTAKATKIADTLTKLGCEVEKADHNGHIDVKYRCPDWKQLDLDSHEEAHKWEKWLKEFQFQTEHKH